MKAEAFVKALDDDRILEAIREAEGRSRGEIRVHVAEGPVDDARAAAQADFERLGMTKTQERNGVLILVAPESQAFAVVGDSGIHERSDEGFWESVADSMRTEFKAERFTEGLLVAVQRVGDELARHFPRRAGETDENELPDGISRG